MTKLITLVTIALLAEGFCQDAPTDEEPQCYVSGICADSQVIRASHGKNDNDCLKTCQDTPGCQWYTYDNGLDLCFSFQNCTYISDMNCRTCTSGQSQCPPRGCDLVGFCKGVLTQYDYLTRLDQCQPWCDGQPNCNFFSFNTNTGLCALFHTCLDLDSEASDFVSGHRGCQVSESGSFTTSAPPPTTTPLASRYFVSEETMDWFQASTFCKSNGGRLAQIYTIEQHQYIQNTYASANKNLWLGLTDRNQEGTFRWEEEPHEVTLQFWSNGQPDDASNSEDCGHYWTASGYLWNDSPCSLNNYNIFALCETI